LNYRSIASALIVAAIALCATAATAATAIATAAGPTSAVAPPVAHRLSDVYCATARNCMAVGQDLNGLRQAGGPLAETWNGTTWRTVGMKLPSGATGGALGRISCLSAKHCIAVGFFSRSGGSQFTLAETWNGRTWTPAQPPAPGGVNTGLTGVSCKSAVNCVAVGAYTQNTSGGPTAAPLAETWNGKKWTETRLPVPRGNLFTGLDAVSCTSAASCVATGTSMTNSASVALIESWNGRTWSKMGAAPVPGSSGGELTGVSCASAKSCAAVGFASFAAKGLGGLTEIWNGKTWTLASVRWPKGTSNELLSGVSCAAANRCMAVGTIDSNLNAMSNTGKAAAVTWNGKAWAVTNVPAPGKGKASLFRGVTCLSGTSCVAVGQLGPARSTNGTGLSGFWNGKSWRLVAAK
jgi:hypothetical protein